MLFQIQLIFFFFVGCDLYNLSLTSDVKSHHLLESDDPFR